MLEFFPFPFFIYLVLIGLEAAFLAKKKHPLLSIIFKLAFSFYLLLLAGVLIFPLPVSIIHRTDYSLDNAVQILLHINLIPFHFSIQDDQSVNLIWMEVVQNILLTVPFGLGLPFIHPVRVRDLLCMAPVVGLGNEILQLLVSMAIVGAAYRTVDISDVILNTSGIWLGYASYTIFASVFITFSRRIKPPPGFWLNLVQWVSEIIRRS